MYYIATGPDDNPLYGGWAEVDAPTKDAAEVLYRLIHPKASRLHVYETVQDLHAHQPYDMQGNHCCLKQRIILTVQTGRELYL